MKNLSYSTTIHTETEIENGDFLEFYSTDKNLENAIYFIDEQVFRLHQPRLNRLKNTIILPQGEECKSLDNAVHLFSELERLNVDKKSLIIGIGGGAVCDLTGFVASIYKRGVRFGFFPTTLLAAVDAAIGGKNGINFLNQKNQLGTIRQPEFIYLDTHFFSTLPKQELLNGFAEIIKYACIADADLFNRLEQENTESIFQQLTILQPIIQKCMDIKIHIISQDPEEKGLRKILNFGHTLGHAIELSENLQHGFAVAVGMNFATWLSEKKGFLDPKDTVRVRNLILKWELPIYFSSSVESIFRSFLGDKKKEGDFIDFILLEAIGKTKVEKINLADLKAYLYEYVEFLK